MKKHWIKNYQYLCYIKNNFSTNSAKQFIKCKVIIIVFGIKQYNIIAEGNLQQPHVKDLYQILYGYTNNYWINHLNFFFKQE